MPEIWVNKKANIALKSETKQRKEFTIVISTTTLDAETEDIRYILKQAFEGTDILIKKIEE